MHKWPRNAAFFSIYKQSIWQRVHNSISGRCISVSALTLSSDNSGDAKLQSPTSSPRARSELMLKNWSTLASRIRRISRRTVWSCSRACLRAGAWWDYGTEPHRHARLLTDPVRARRRAYSVQKLPHACPGSTPSKAFSTLTIASLASLMGSCYINSPCSGSAWHDISGIEAARIN